MTTVRHTFRRLVVTETFVTAVSLATAALAMLGPADQKRVLLFASTNLHGLAHRPVLVLLASVLWVSPFGLLGSVIPAAVVIGIVEWRIGSLRALLVLVAGHVGATLLTAAGIVEGIHAGTLPASISDTLDVGTSYATMAALGFAVGLVKGAARLVVGAFLLGLLSASVALDRDFTSFGHLFAALIGLSLVLAGVGATRPGHRRAAAGLVGAIVLAAPFAGYAEVGQTAGAAVLDKIPGRVLGHPESHRGGHDLRAGQRLFARVADGQNGARPV